MAKKRPYSMDYTARENPRRYLLSGIPPNFWLRVRQKARREHVSMRALILRLLNHWLNNGPPKTKEEVEAETEPAA